MNVGFRERDADLALLRELARLRERGGRESDGGNVDALLREPHAVAAFAAGDRQRAAGLWLQRREDLHCANLRDGYPKGLTMFLFCSI